MDKVVHFEVPADDVERAKEFYKKVFDWKLIDFNPGYTIARTVECDDKNMPLEKGAINGGIMKREDIAKAPVIVINVPSVEEYFKKIEEAGGKKLTDKKEIPNMGYYAYVSDPEGNVIGIWEDIKK